MEKKDSDDKKLRPIERLFLISQEKKEVFNNKNSLHCLIYYLLENKNIIFSKEKVKLNITGTNDNKIYEELFLGFLRDRKYIELDKFLSGLNNFENTLIDQGFLASETRIKKVLLLKLAKQKVVKTSSYFKLFSEYLDKLQNNISVIDIVCDNKESKERVLKVHGLIKNKIIQAYKKKQLDIKND